MQPLPLHGSTQRRVSGESADDLLPTPRDDCRRVQQCLQVRMTAMIRCTRRCLRTRLRARACDPAGVGTATCTHKRIARLRNDPCARLLLMGACWVVKHRAASTSLAALCHWHMALQPSSSSRRQLLQIKKRAVA